jgi:hypothetical protein
LKNISLTTSIAELSADIQETLNQLEILNYEKILNQSQLNVFESKKNDWMKSVEQLFSKHFSDPDNFLITEFKWSSRERFGGIYFAGMKETFEDKVRDSQWPLHDRGRFLEDLNKLIPELDSITGKEPVIEIEDVDIDDLFYLILYKLRRLKSDDYHSVKYILLGNGVELTKSDELSQILRELSDKYFIQTSGEHEARITVKGELQLNKLEKSRKRIVATKNKDTIDEVMLELKKLGLGQEILFDELEELKGLASKLNKKNWKQIVKGKLVDLTLSKVISNETAKFIFDKVVPGDGIINLLK